MVLISQNRVCTLWRAFRIALLIVWITGSSISVAQDNPDQGERQFPGLTEVVPKATSVAARLAEARTVVSDKNTRQTEFSTLDRLSETLAGIEKQFDNWEDIENWQINRLLRAQAIYADLREQMKKPLQNIYQDLKTIEDLRRTWEEERSYWQEWRAFLKKNDIKVPKEVFPRTLSSINELLERVNQVGADLVLAQQKYSPVQETIDSRISTIDKNLGDLRRDTLRQNAYSLFEPDYYRQFDSELFNKFIQNLLENLKIPRDLIKRHGGPAAFQLCLILIGSLLLIYRKKQAKPLPEEWQFLFRRPFAGAFFIVIIFLNLVTDLNHNLPLAMRWALMMAIMVSAMRLVNAFYETQLAKRMVRTIFALFIISESVRFFGFPTPMMQLFSIFLCVLTISTCWILLRKRALETQSQRFLITLILGFAILVLAAALFGLENLSTNLVDATLTTFIVIILVKMSIHLSDSGIETFMQVRWIKDRHFIEVLGLDEATKKLQTLVRILIFVNTILYMMVTWLIFDSMAEARETIFGFEFTVGEFAFSVKMVLVMIVILYLTSIFSWVFQAFIDSQIMTPKKMAVGVKESLKRLTHYALFTMGFLIAVSAAGLDLQKFTILAGALGVGIGFGMQNIVNNFISGLILLFERPVKVGDIINLDQDWGTITKIGLRSTIMETFDRSEIIVPNADLISQKVTNWTFSNKMSRVILKVGVAYGSPLETVLEVLERAAQQSPEVLKYPKPNAIFVGFGDSSIDFELRVWISDIDNRLKVHSDLGVIIDRLFRENDIQIPFPQRDLHLRSVDTNLQSTCGAKTTQPTPDSEDQSE